MNTVTDKKALQAQKRSCVAVLKAFSTAEGKKEDARNKLFAIFADHLTGSEDQSKAAKLSIKIFCAHNGHANVKELCEGTGLNLRAEFSMISTVAGLLVDCKSFTDVRRAYDAERANKSKKKPAAKKATGSQSEAAEPEAAEHNLEAPQMVGALLEEFNKLSQMDNIAQHRVAELIKAARKELHKEAQQKLKIAKAA